MLYIHDDDLNKDRYTEYFLSLSIKDAFCQHHNLKNCLVSLNENIATILISIPDEISYERALQYDNNLKSFDILHLKVDLTTLSPYLINRIKKIFKNYVKYYELFNDQKQWIIKKNENKLLQGLVHKKFKNFIHIKVLETLCVLEKSEWVSNEFYIENKVYFFHILNIKIDFKKKNTIIFLSRKCQKLPASLLRSKIPLYNFDCIKRIAGKISYVITNAPIKHKQIREAVKNVSEELNNEYIKLLPFKEKS